MFKGTCISVLMRRQSGTQAVFMPAEQYQKLVKTILVLSLCERGIQSYPMLTDLVGLRVIDYLFVYCRSTYLCVKAK